MKAKCAYVFLGFFLMVWALPLRAEPAKEQVRAVLDEIVRLGNTPKISQEDKEKLTGLYGEMKNYGQDALPVLEEVLKSKEDILPKKAALFSIKFIYSPDQPAAVNEKICGAIPYYKEALEDPAAQVRGLAVQSIAETSCPETLPLMNEVYARETDPRIVLTAFNRIAFYPTDSADEILKQADFFSQERARVEKLRRQILQEAGAVVREAGADESGSGTGEAPAAV